LTKKELSVNAVRLLASRYLLRDESGRLIETPEGMVLRVGSAVAAAEVKYSTFNIPLPDDFIQNTYIMESVFRLSINSPQPIRNNYVIDAFERFKRLIFEKRVLPNSPTLFNAGTRLGQLSACLVLPIENMLA